MERGVTRISLCVCVFARVGTIVREREREADGESDRESNRGSSSTLGSGRERGAGVRYNENVQQKATYMSKQGLSSAEGLTREMLASPLMGLSSISCRIALAPEESASDRINKRQEQIDSLKSALSTLNGEGI